MILGREIMKKSNLDSRVRQILKAANLYCTECRIAILKVLTGATKPLTQNQIAQKLRKNHLNKVTIYRTLDSFRRAGLVHKAFLRKRTWHFELAYHCGEILCHPHFTCTSCGLTHCLTGLSVPLVKGLKEKFVIHRQQIQLDGLCPACSAKAAKAS